MKCRVISISRALGAGGEEIGRDVASRLRFRFVDDEIVAGAAQKAGVSPETIERAERTPPLIDRILQLMGTSAVEPAGYVPAHVPTSPAYEALIEQVIRETASQGNVVIVAHGASIPLAGETGVLRVLVTGSPTLRATRLSKATNTDERKAKKAVDDSDRQRREYLQRFYNIRAELPTHYDLVVNTDVLELTLAADIITVAAKGSQKEISS
jgi:cytidylate kinase